MTADAFGRAPLGSELDTDLIADGVAELAEELRLYAASAPAVRAGLTDRVLAALDGELAQRTPGIAPLAPVPFLSRLALGLRPASFRSLLAAAALVAVLGAGAAFAAAGGLPFQLPHIWAPEQAAPVQPDSQQPAGPGDEDEQGPVDTDVDTSPDPSEDADEDQDEDSDAHEDQDEDNDDEDEDGDGDEDSDNGDEDNDEDEDSGNGDEDNDEDEDSDNGDEDSDNGDEDSGNGDEDDESNDDSTQVQDESDEDGDGDEDSDQTDSANAGSSEEN